MAITLLVEVKQQLGLSRIAENSKIAKDFKDLKVYPGLRDLWAEQR